MSMMKTLMCKTCAANNGADTSSPYCRGKCARCGRRGNVYAVLTEK